MADNVQVNVLGQSYLSCEISDMPSFSGSSHFCRGS